jgi:hypothetical protein
MGVAESLKLSDGDIAIIEDCAHGSIVSLGVV